MPISAPVVKEAGVTYSPVRFNGTFMREDVYRQPGSPEVDAAWEALGVDCKKSPARSVRLLTDNHSSF